MLTTATSTSLIGTYDRSGRMGASLRSEPARPVVTIGDQCSTTAGKYKDKVTLSPDGIEKSREEEAAGKEKGSEPGTTESGSLSQGKGTPADLQGLTPAETTMVRELQARDREVRTHETAHLASAGQYARGGPSYTYQHGPDGRRYAIGGEVPIDMGKEATPEKTIQKMETIKQAALAPAEPSAADRTIAANAAAMENRARQELRTQQAAEADQSQDGGTSAEPEEDAPASPSAAPAAMGTAPRPDVDVFA